MKRTGLHFECEAEACTIMDRASTISRLSEEAAAASLITASSSMSVQLGPQEAHTRHKLTSPLSTDQGLFINQRSQLDTHADWGYSIRIPRALRIRPTAAATNTLRQFIVDATTQFKPKLADVMDTEEAVALFASEGEALLRKIRSFLLKLLPSASTLFHLLNNGTPEWSAVLLKCVLVFTSARAALLNQDMVGDVPFETLRSVVLQAHGSQSGRKPQNSGRFDCVVS